MLWHHEESDATKDRISHEIEAIDASIYNIVHLSVNKALLEDDEYKAWEIFDHARKWRIEEHLTFDADQYLVELGKLRDMGRAAGMVKVVHELDNTIEFMEENTHALQSVLSNFRRQRTYEGLRENYMNN
jgi:hypothetical protein